MAVIRGRHFGCNVCGRPTRKYEADPYTGGAGMGYSPRTTAVRGYAKVCTASTTA
jgi:hypothetical protein